MIKLKEYTPDVYYSQSRDFQFIGRLFDLVLNSVKTEADLVYNIPSSDDSNDKLLDLLALTLGFKANHHYNTKQLRAICKVFPSILKNKGSIQAVIIACNALFNAEGLEQSLDYDFEVNADKTIDYTKLNLYIPQEFGDITIINDLLTYILPAGMSCNIIKELRIKAASLTEIAVDSIFKVYQAGDFRNGGVDNKMIFYNNNIMAKVPKLSNTADSNRKTGVLNTTDAIKTNTQDNAGFLANTSVYQGNAFIANEYKIIYDLNGGSWNTDAHYPTSYRHLNGVGNRKAPKRYTILSTEITKAGAIFKGWKNTETGTTVTEISSTESGDKYLQAIWETETK